MSLPADLVESMKHDAGGNMSAYVEKVLRRQQLIEAGEKIRAWRGETSPITDEIGVELALELR